MRLAFDGTNSVRFIGISTLEEFKFRQCPSKSAVADPVEGPGGPFPSLSQGLDDRPPPHPPYLKIWIRHWSAPVVCPLKDSC